MAYRAPRLFAPPGSSPEVVSFIDQLQRELDQIAREFVDSDFIQLKKTHAVPAKPREGIIVYADGTDWDPGSGEGYYGYYGAAWRKLG